MKFKINNKYFRWGLTAFLAIAAGIVFYYFVFHSSNIRAALKTITDILMPVVVGMAIAYLLTPMLNFVESKILYPICRILKIRDGKRKNSIVRGIGILTTAFLFIGLIYLLFFMLISQIVPSIQNIAMNFDSYTANITKWLNKALEDNPEVGEYVIKTVNTYSSDLEKWITGILPDTAAGLIKTVSMSVLSAFNVLWDFIIGFIISIYVMSSKEKFAGQAKKIIYAVFEQDTSNVLIRNLRFTHDTFIGFLGGKIVDSIIIGVLCLIGCTILKTPYGALVSVIIGCTNIIPFFGPFLGAIPSAFLIFVVDPMHPLNCLYFVLFILILQQVDGNIIGPKILGSSTGLTGFWVIFAITLFGGLFGVLGMIIGVPILAVIYAGIRAAVNTALDKKQLPTESVKYERLEYVDENGFHELRAAETEQNKGKNDNPSRRGKHSGWHWKWIHPGSSTEPEKNGEKDNEISDSKGK